MTTLTSIAEVSNVFSILTVFLVFLIMVIFILRLHGDDYRLSNSTSVIYVDERPVHQTPMIKINNPFVFKIANTQNSLHKQGVVVSISSQIPYFLYSMWGVTITDFHYALSTSWSEIKEKILTESFLTSGTVHQELIENNSPGNDLQICLSPPDCFTLEDLGSTPRIKYPLVAILLKQNQGTDDHELGAMINIVHIRDEIFQLPSYVMAQYLKMVDDQVTLLKPLFMSDLSSDSERNTPSDENTETLCVICQSEPVTRALLPCRHACSCKGCFNRLDKCPMCRSRIRSYFCIHEEATTNLSRNTEFDGMHQPVGWRQRYELWNEWLTQSFGLS